MKKRLPAGDTGPDVVHSHGIADRDGYPWPSRNATGACYSTSDPDHNRTLGFEDSTEPTSLAVAIKDGSFAIFLTPIQSVRHLSHRSGPGLRMPIPTYESCMHPLLRLLSDGRIHTTKDVVAAIEDHFNLTEEERERLLPSGQTRYIVNRVGWAKTYLKNAGLLENTQRGQIRITETGRRFLESHPTGVTSADLTAEPSFVEFLQRRRGTDTSSSVTPRTDAAASTFEPTPDEAIENAYETIRETLAAEVLEQVQKSSPAFFERLVLDLLIAMGYGGALPERGTHLGQSGDGGIDGVISEDKLGLDVICVQAKRWKDSVGRPVVQAFAGSMEAHRAKKGVMITTSTFTSDAQSFVERIERKIVLIDGRQLAQLMIDHDVGVAPDKTYTIKKVDSDYFLEEQ